MADQKIALFRTAIGETLDYLASRDVPAPSTVVLDVHETLTNYQDFDGPLRSSHVRAAFTQLAEDGVLAQAQWREGSRSAEVTCEERERARTLRNCTMDRGMLILEVAPGGAYWERALEGDLFVKVQMTYQLLWSVNEDTAGFGFRWTDDQWHLSDFRANGPE